MKPTPKKEIDEDKVNDLLSAIEELEAESFIDKPTGKEKFKYVFEIKIENEKDEKKSKTIRIAISDIQENFVLIKNWELPYLFQTSKEIIDKLPKKIDDFIKKKEDKVSDNFLNGSFMIFLFF